MEPSTPVRGVTRIELTQEALAQLLGVRRTTVMSTMNKLREVDCIKTDRRGLLEIDRTRLENVACECYGVMRHRIKRLHNEELIGALERRHMRE